MSVQTTTVRPGDPSAEDTRAITQRGVLERLADPYLTDHDRWVLGQFARFLAGEAPGPDPRAARPRPSRGATLFSRVRRAKL